MILPTGIRGRWVALGLLLVIIIVTYQLTLAPLWARYQALAPAITEQQQQVQRYQRLAAQAPQLRERLQLLRNDARFNDYLVAGNGSALAAAALQQRLQGLAQAHHGQVLSTRVGKPQTEGDFERITLNARLQINLVGLQELLNSLETQSPYLFVRNLSIYRQTGRNTQNQAQLEVQLDIDGLRMPGESDNG